MYEQIEKPKENKSRAVANSVTQKKSAGKQGFGFVDNRPQTIVQRNIQEKANNFPQANQSETIQLKPKESKHNRKNKRLAKHLGLHTSSFSDTATTSDKLAEPEARDEGEALDREIERCENAAHGVDVSNTREITLAQEKYQKLLFEKMGTGQIMDTHRSVGFEYEFATYEVLNKAIKIDSHNELGHSKPISPLFNIPFKLETDSDDELEVVTPPLLIANDENTINKGAAKILYSYYKESAKNLRDKNEGKVVSTLKMADEGFGHDWEFSGKARSLIISADRQKHRDGEDKIYSQMNISLTPEETADFMDRQSMDSGVNDKANILERTDIFSKAYFKIKHILDDGINRAIEETFTS